MSALLIGRVSVILQPVTFIDNPSHVPLCQVSTVVPHLKL